MESRNYKEVYSEMRSYMIANQKKVTDFNQGSVISTIFEAVARIVETIYIDIRIGYTNLLKQIAYSIFGFKKKKGVKANVKVRFKRNKATTSQTLIASGVKISDGTHTFTTSENAIIPENELESNEIYAQADSIGVEYNVMTGAISNIESYVPSEVVEVTNTEKAEGGADSESDADMLSRFKMYINGLQGSTKYGIQAGVLALDGVRSIGIDEHFPPKLDIFNFTIYVDDGTGRMTDKLKKEVQTVIDGDDSSVNHGLRACGINCEILAADIVPITIDLSCLVYRVEEQTALFKIKETIENLINSLKIGENILQTDIILELRHIDYIKDVSNLKINGQKENFSISISQIARIENINIELKYMD